MKGKGKKAYWRAENEWWWSEGLGGGTNGCGGNGCCGKNGYGDGCVLTH